MVRAFRGLEKGKEKEREEKRWGKEEEKGGRGPTGAELKVGFDYDRPFSAQGLSACCLSPISEPRADWGRGDKTKGILL